MFSARTCSTKLVQHQPSHAHTHKSHSAVQYRHACANKLTPLVQHQPHTNTHKSHSTVQHRYACANNLTPRVGPHETSSAQRGDYPRVPATCDYPDTTPPQRCTSREGIRYLLLSKVAEDKRPVLDTGAGIGITPKQVTNPVSTNITISGYQGQHTQATKIGDLGPLRNMLHVPTAEQTLVSAGCMLDGMTPDTALVIKKDGAFRFPDVQITTDKWGRAFCQTGPNPGIKVAERAGPGAVYRIIDVNRLHQQQPDILQRCICHISALTLSHKSSKGRRNALLLQALQAPAKFQTLAIPTAELGPAAQKKAIQLSRLHRAYGHASPEYIRRALARSSVKAHRELSRFTHLMPLCNACLDGRNRRAGKRKQEARLDDEVRSFAAHLHVDNSGPQSVKSFAGFVYYMIIICKHSSFTWVKFLKALTDSASKFSDFLKDMQQVRKMRTHVVRTDAGPADFANPNFQSVLDEHNIAHEMSAGSSTHNARAERRISTTTDDCLANLKWADAPRTWWAYAVAHGVTTRNLMPCKSNTGWNSPYEEATGRAADLAILQPFGCLVFILVARRERQGKTNHNNTSHHGVMLGYQLRRDRHPFAYKIYDLKTHRIRHMDENEVRFNPDMPAMKFIAQTSNKNAATAHLGAVVAKTWGSETYYGRILSNREDTDGQRL